MTVGSAEIEKAAPTYRKISCDTMSGRRPRLVGTMLGSAGESVTWNMEVSR